MVEGNRPPSRQTVYHRSDELVLREIAGESLLVPVAGDLARIQAVWVLNPVSAFIWERLDGKKSLADLQTLVLAEFDVSAEQAEADLLAFVGELEDSGLVKA